MCLQVVHGNVCVVCRETMKSEDEFYAHCQQHHAAAITAAAVAASSTSAGSTITPSSIPCIVCRQTLVSALELTLHARHHYRSNQHQQQQQQQSCCVCSTTDGLLSPVCTANNSLYYICVACDRRDGLAQLNVVTSTSFKSFQCIKCQQSFSSEHAVRLHVATHVIQDGTVHRCQLCSADVTFDSPARLQSHLISEHEFAGVTDAPCDVCGLRMSGPVAARQHALEHGPTAWKHACSRCPLKFFFAAQLRNHQLVEGHGPVTSPGHTASHQSSDSVDDQLRCTDCSRMFSGYASLCSHRRVHEKNTSASVNDVLDCSSGPRERSGSAPSRCIDTRSELGTALQCPECSRQFPSLSSLQGHMRVHRSGT